MTLHEFIKRLDQKNLLYDTLCDHLWEKHLSTLFASKETETWGIVMRLQGIGKSILVDKRLGVVFGVVPGNHEQLIIYLLKYHEANVGRYFADPDPDELIARYISEGFGYFIPSTLRKTPLIISRGYEPDSFDRDLFAIMRTR